MASVFQEISSNKLLETSKEVILTNDVHLANWYLSLMKYSSNYNWIGTKIQAIYHLSIIHNKNKALVPWIRLGKKILKLSKTLDLKRYNNEVIIIMIKTLLNCVEILIDKDNFVLAGWFLFLAKSVYIENSIQSDETNRIIKAKFPIIIKKLNEEYNEIYFNLKPKKENLFRLSEQIKHSIKVEKYTKGEKLFLINSKWIKNMLSFVINFNNPKNKSDLFQANNICLIYYDQNFEETDDLKGSYCGAINNFELIEHKLHWEDSEKKHMNVFLKNGLENARDYQLVKEELYKRINFYFGNNYEIERYCIDDNNNIELNFLPLQVLFINETIRERHKEDLIPKYIQMSHSDNFATLNTKVQDCFINYTKTRAFDEDSYNYKIYLMKYVKKDIVEMVISYTNFNKNCKIQGQNIRDISEEPWNKYFKEKERKSPGKILNENEEKYYILCEAISRNTITKPFLIKMGETINCSWCNFKIESLDKAIRCSHCSQANYCSDNCKNKDNQHIEFHKKISSWYEVTIQTEEIQHINIKAFLDGKSRHGWVGLRNTGGLDFLLSAIQLLSHCNTFTKFFLSNNYLDSSGKAKDMTSLVHSYAELINQLWVGSLSEITPNAFRNTFFSMLKDISNTSNIDAFDILIVLLDKLHGEWNEIKQKPEDAYFYEVVNGETDKQACSRWWKTHQSMNKSIIIDLFQGQLKMQIKCSYCKNNSITFPPFLYIGLPIPDKEESTKIRFRVFPNNFNYNYISVEMFDINKFTSIKDIKKRIKEYSCFTKSKIVALLYKDCELVQLLEDEELVYDYIFTRYNFSDEEFIDWEISFAEVPDNTKGDLLYFYVTPITFEQEKTYFYTYNKILPWSYTHVVSMNQKLTWKDLYKEIFKYYRRSIDDMIGRDETTGNIDGSYYNDFYNRLQDDNYIDAEFNKCINKNNPFDVYFHHNFEKSNSWIFSGPSCEYCKSAKNDYCKAKMELSLPLKELILMQKIKREIFILVDFTKFKDNFTDFYLQYSDPSDARMSLHEEINIYDCCDIFQKEEKLKKEKDYICPRCSRKVEPIQQVQPYKAPLYWWVNIKRFKKKFDDWMDMINNKKNESMVEYPINNLNLTSYFLGEEEDVVYDLCGTINHTGQLKNGHYSTVCKNEEDWYLMDDHVLKKLTTVQEVVTKDAYILMYKKRENEKKKFKETEDILDMSNPSINAEVKEFGEMKGI